jgi:hypothetical protein
MGNTTSQKIRCPEKMNSRNKTLNNSPSSESKTRGNEALSIQWKNATNEDESAQLKEKRPNSSHVPKKDASLFSDPK